MQDYHQRLAGGEGALALDEEFRDKLGHRVTYLNCGGATPMPEVSILQLVSG